MSDLNFEIVFLFSVVFLQFLNSQPFFKLLCILKLFPHLEQISFHKSFEIFWDIYLSQNVNETLTFWSKYIILVMFWSEPIGVSNTLELLGVFLLLAMSCRLVTWTRGLGANMLMWF